MARSHILEAALAELAGAGDAHRAARSRIRVATLAPEGAADGPWLAPSRILEAALVAVERAGEAAADAAALPPSGHQS